MKLAVAVLAALAAAAPAAAAPRWHVSITATRTVNWSVDQSTSCTSTSGAGQEVTTFATPAGSTVGVSDLLRPAGSALKLVVRSTRGGTLTSTPSGTCQTGCAPPLWQQYTGTAAPDRCDETLVAPESSCGTRKATIADGHGFLLGWSSRSSRTLEVALDATSALFPKGCPGYGDSPTRPRGIFGSPKLTLATLMTRRSVRVHGAYAGEHCASGGSRCPAPAGVNTRASWTIVFTRVG